MSEFLRQCSPCDPTHAPADPGAQLVAQANKTLQEILDGIDRVHQSILQMDTLAQQNAAQAEEARQLRSAGHARLRVVT